MPYVRISIAKPRPGQDARVQELMRKINDFAAQAPGCREVFLLRPHDNSGEIARMAIYEDEHSAEAAASSQTVMALRSELHLHVEAGHIERAFFTE